MADGVVSPATAVKTPLRIGAGLLVCAAAFGTAARPAGAETKILTVGPSGIFQYRTIGAAVAAADADSNPNSYYDIQVAPGTYTNDFPVVTRPMTIEVDPAGQEAPCCWRRPCPCRTKKGSS